MLTELGLRILRCYVESKYRIAVDQNFSHHLKTPIEEIQIEMKKLGKKGNDGNDGFAYVRESKNRYRTTYFFVGELPPKGKLALKHPDRFLNVNEDASIVQNINQDFSNSSVGAINSGSGNFSGKVKQEIAQPSNMKSEGGLRKYLDYLRISLGILAPIIAIYFTLKVNGII